MKKENDSLCQSFEKAGSCSKGDACRYVHRNYEMSRCLVFHHMFPDPDLFRGLLSNPEIIPLTAEKRQNIIDAFYLDVFIVMRQFGILDDLLICGNRSDHLCGNVLAMYKEVNSAVAAQSALNGQFYAGRRLSVTFAPIARMSNAICRQADGECPMGDQCAFVHPLNPSKHVMSECFPRGMKAYALPFRTVKQQKIWDTPTELLYGQTKMRKEED